jgi:5'-deoxynucleotidase YfbR-like HD superfamily hydrolase
MRQSTTACDAVSVESDSPADFEQGNSDANSLLEAWRRASVDETSDPAHVAALLTAWEETFARETKETTQRIDASQEEQARFMQANDDLRAALQAWEGAQDDETSDPEHVTALWRGYEQAQARFEEAHARTQATYIETYGQAAFDAIEAAAGDEEDVPYRELVRQLEPAIEAYVVAVRVERMAEAEVDAAVEIGDPVEYARKTAKWTEAFERQREASSKMHDAVAGLVGWCRPRRPR